MVEALVYNALLALAGGNVFPDLAPPHTATPWITYNVVGGSDSAYLDGFPSARNAIVQIDVWAATRMDAATLMEDVRTALINPTVKGVPQGSPVGTFEADTKLYGSRLDFSITY
jgi:hypothetical protein